MFSFVASLFVLTTLTASNYAATTIAPPIGVKDVPSILQAESTKLLDEGGDFEMECVVPTTKNVLVTFVKTYKDKAYAISVDLLKQYDDRNATMVYDKYGKTYSFAIQGVTRSDSATYTCEFIDLTQLTEKPNANCLTSVTLSRTELKVLSPPEITAISISATAIHEGNPVTLECYASGYPEPIVFWKRQDGEKLNNASVSKYPKSVLKILPATKKDSGVYECTAENSVGKAVTKSVRLSVYGKRQLTTEKNDVTEGIYEDEE